MVVSVSGFVANITQFDDGSSAQNLTSNTTKYITLPLNSSIQQANLTLSGTGYNCVDSNYNSPACGQSGTGNLTTQTAGNTRNLTYRWPTPGNINISTQIQITNGSGAPSEFSHRNMSIAGEFITGTEFILSIFINTATENVDFYSINRSNSEWVLLNTTNETAASIEYIHWVINASSNVLGKINGSLFFNQTGEHTSTNYTTFVSGLETCNNLQVQCPLTITADAWGRETWTSLFIEYNKSNAALLNIVSPLQITASITTGSTYDANNINITNTGDWNATNISFETISTSTPNLNDSISFVCTSPVIVSGSSVLCNVTFSSIVVAPETDEQLRLRSLNGTNDETSIISNSIDVDITVSAAALGTGGGGGGQQPRCDWKVFSPYNRVIQKLGYFGYQSNPSVIQVLNNQSQALSFNYRVEDVDCQLEKTSQVIEGNSLGQNFVVCKYPVEQDTGLIVVEAGGCSQSIDVKLVSNQLGLVLTYFFGGAGVVAMIASWTVLFAGAFVFGKFLGGIA